MTDEERLSGEAGATQVAAETPAAETAPVAQTVETPPVQSAPAAETSPVAQPQVTQDPMAPVKALLEERDRRQAAERKAAEYEAREAARERQRKEAAAEVPNMLDDPEGYHAWVVQQLNGTRDGFKRELSATAFQTKMNVLRRVWSKELGGRDKLVDLEKWAAQQSPDWLNWCNAQEDPFEAAQEARQERDRAERAKSLEAELGGKDLAAFLEEKKQQWLAENAGAQQPASQQETRTRNPDGTFASTSTPQRHQPPSLSVVTGAAAPRGAEVRSGYDALFKK